MQRPPRGPSWARRRSPLARNKAAPAPALRDRAGWATTALSSTPTALSCGCPIKTRSCRPATKLKRARVVAPACAQWARIVSSPFRRRRPRWRPHRGQAGQLTEGPKRGCSITGPPAHGRRKVRCLEGSHLESPFLSAWLRCQVELEVSVHASARSGADRVGRRNRCSHVCIARKGSGWSGAT